jgi:hypothetical protein
MDHRERDAFFSLLSPAELEDWEAMESWSYANDGERHPSQWGEGPRFLGMELSDWVQIAEKAPRLVDVCQMVSPVERWKANLRPEANVAKLEALLKALAKVDQPEGPEWPF